MGVGGIGSFARLLASGTGLVLMAGLAQAQPAPVRGSVAIRETSHGVPHVLASDLRGVGYGAGYAQARIAICEMAGRFVTVRAERSLFFGADSNVPDGPARVTNLESDFFWQRIRDERLVERELALPEPIGPSASLRQLIEGFAAGYNRYLADTGVASLPDKRCAGRSWVRPITAHDVYLRAMHWNLYRSGGALVRQLVAATPQGAPARTASILGHIDKELRRGDGSNMIALGAEATDNGRGMLFANPHWTWEGPDSWIEAHLTVPGKLNVIGMQTIGLPVVQTGFNDNVAWAGTTSFANRYTFYKLKLVPGSRDTVLIDGKPRRLTPRRVRVRLRAPDSRIVTREHVFWESPFGLVFVDKDLPWSTGSLYAVKDVAYSFRWLSQQLRINQATSAKDLSTAAAAYMAIGWRNLSAADKDGNVFYGDRTAIPAVPNELARTCAADRGSIGRGRGADILVLDGSRSACDWATFADAPVRGIFGAAQLPQLHRRDYILQSNDTHWLNNLRQPLEGFPSLMGPERTARTLRTRNAIDKVESRLAGTDGLPGNRFTLPLLKTITMDNRVFTANLWLDDVLAMCANPAMPSDFAEVGRVLRAWDRRNDVDSRGALLWRRFAERLAPDGMRTGALDLYRVPFDVKRPVATPTGLRTEDPRVKAALRGAIDDLRGSGIALDARLGDYQYSFKGAERIPVAGGVDVEGQYNLTDARRGWVPGQGYPDVWSGSSFIMWMQFTDTGPRGQSIMTMSQSRDPGSPFFADQSRMWVGKQTKAMLFDEADIARDRNLKITRLRFQR